ncbi:MAG: hypothetical protein OXU45_06835 [Candidatus Melainabacteria bacterium]|nr:hypothetical protein [Candidatus Melainabacteria bacterium]
MLNAGTNANVNYGSANAATTSGAQKAKQVFNLSARVVAEQRPQQQVQNRQIDPAVLARIALEEELKRRGGGGGGFRNFNPLNFVPYSFKLMSAAMERMRQAFNQAMSQAFNLPAPVANAVQQVQNYVTNLFNAPILQNFNTAINQSFAQLAQALQNPGQTAARLATNIMQLASTMASAVAAGLKKVFGDKEEDRLDPDNQYFQEDEGFLKRVWGVFADVSNDGNQSNARNIKSHIDNLAKQVTHFFNKFRFGS